MQVYFLGDFTPKAPLKIVDGFAIANLECAFADGIVASEKAYSSVLPLSCIENIASGGFAALSVANNHVNDAGNFQKTYAELTQRFPNIQFFGTKEKPYAQFEAEGKTVFVIGCLEPCRSRGDLIFKQEDVACLIRQLRNSAAQVLVYVYAHWGKEGEYTRYPAPWQLRLAREWIDAGADGVFGSHSHVPQGREYYQGKPIYYSLGNFDFDHPEGKQYEGTDDRLRVTIDVGNEVEVIEQFSSEKVRESVEIASAELVGWNKWKWAKKVGPLYLKKNTASWKLRLKKNCLKTLPKFLVWQLLPNTLFLRVASLWSCKK